MREQSKQRGQEESPDGGAREHRQVERRVEAVEFVERERAQLGLEPRQEHTLREQPLVGRVVREPQQRVELELRDKAQGRREEGRPGTRAPAEGAQGREDHRAHRARSRRARPGVEAKTVAELREALRKNLIGPMEMVMLTRERIEEALEEAVERGRMTSADAQGLATGLLERGRKQTNDVLKDLEQLLGRGRDEIEGRTSGVRRRAGGAVGGARKQASGARSRAVRAASPALAQADRAAARGRGRARTSRSPRYDDLTADQVVSRLSGLTPAELRKVRDYERRNANRKTVLNAIESKLSS